MKTWQVVALVVLVAVVALVAVAAGVYSRAPVVGRTYGPRGSNVVPTPPDTIEGPSDLVRGNLAYPAPGEA